MQTVATTPSSFGTTGAKMSSKPSIFESSSLGEFLAAVYAYRRSKNPSFSRQAFARHLGISGAMFTYLVKGTRSLAPKSIGRIAERLKLDPREEEYFALLAQSAGAASAGQQARLATRMRAYRKRPRALGLPLDRFPAVSHWYIFALLEICAIRPLGPVEALGVAKSLKIGPSEIDRVLRELHRIGLLARDDLGFYERVHGEVTVAASVKRADVDRFHAEVLAKARATVTTADPADRIYASVFYSIRKSRLPELRAKLYELLDEFHDESFAEREPDAVYGLSAAFFPIFEGSRPVCRSSVMS